MTQESKIDLSSLHALEIRTLRVYEGKEEDEQTDTALPAAAGIGPGQVRRAIEWLISKDLVEISQELTVSVVSLTELGVAQADVGATPETALLLQVGKDPSTTLKDLQSDTRFDRGDWGSAFGGLKGEGVIDQKGPAIEIADLGAERF